MISEHLGCSLATIITTLFSCNGLLLISQHRSVLNMALSSWHNELYLFIRGFRLACSNPIKPQPDIVTATSEYCTPSSNYHASPSITYTGYYHKKHPDSNCRLHVICRYCSPLLGIRPFCTSSEMLTAGVLLLQRFGTYAFLQAFYNILAPMWRSID